MHKIRSWIAALPPKTRRVFYVLGITTLGFFVISLATIGDLLAPVDINDFIVNPVPILLCLLGLISTILAVKGKARLGSYLLIAGITVGFFVISIFTVQPAYSTIAELLIVVLPLMIAIQSLSERESIWIIVLALVGRSAIQIISTFKATSPISGASAQTELIAQWSSIIIAVLFGLYIAFNLNNYAFRIKMILVLGLLTILPTAILTSVSRNNLESMLVGEANQNLVFTSNQIASSINSFLLTTLDTTRTEAQVPILSEYVGQPRPSFNGGQLFPRGTNLETAAMDTLQSFVRKDPINIVSVRLLDNTGTIQLSTKQEDLAAFMLTQDYYFTPSTNGLPFVSHVLISSNGLGIMHFSAPVRSAAGYTIGVLDVIYSASILQQMIVQSSNTLGSNVSTMLMDDSNIILAHSSQPNLIYKIINPPDIGTIAVLTYENRLQNLKPEELSIQMDGLTLGLENLSTVPYFSGNFELQKPKGSVRSSDYQDQAGAAKLQSQNWHVVTYVPQSTLLAPVQSQTRSVVLISILIGLIGIAVALGVTQVLVSPILSLTSTSEKITQGEINAVAVVNTQDEIGELATAFNSMTERIRGLVSSLEQRVAERTHALELRAVQLQAAADVGSTAARLRDLDELLRHATRSISQRFGYYHIGIFLIDEYGEYAVLRASNSEGGQRMLAREHKLKVGEVGIVGNVAGSGQPRIALNVGQDTEFFNNPDLHTTQSEMALPLVAGGKILGVLDIQSEQESAFTNEDITTLKVLADQIAIAIENARLFAENQASLEAARQAYGELGREDWQRLLGGSRASPGYIAFSKDQVTPVKDEPKPEFLEAIKSGQPIVSKDGLSLHLPIKIRNEAIGAIRLDKPNDSGQWTAEDITTAASLSDQLGIALDSARLYTDISQRAEREYLISEITSKIGSSIRLETILRTTVEELGHAFGDSEVVLQIGDHARNIKGNESE